MGQLVHLGELALSQDLVVRMATSENLPSLLYMRNRTGVKDNKNMEDRKSKRTGLKDYKLTETIERVERYRKVERRWNHVNVRA